MRAVVLTGYGGVDRLEYRDDWPRPETGPLEVLIRVGACGVNNTDLNTRTGWYAPTVSSGMTEELAASGGSEGHEPATWNQDGLSFPRIQGGAIAGEIVAVGVEVSAGRIGERVLVDPVVRDESLPRWARGVVFVGSECDGGYAEYAAVPAENAFAVETPLADVELASFPVSHTTAEEMLTRVELTGGETVLVTGASGGVGTALVQLAKLRGARVIAVASQEKAPRLRELGADLFVPRDTDDLAGTVHELVGERAVDVVCDVVGGPILIDLLRVLRRGGRFATGGAIAGPVAEIDLRDLIYKDLTLIGVANPERQTTEKLVSYIERGEIAPLVDAVYPLERLAEAQLAFAARRHVGKLVIDVAGAAA